MADFDLQAQTTLSSLQTQLQAQYDISILAIDSYVQAQQDIIQTFIDLQLANFQQVL